MNDPGAHEPINEAVEDVEDGPDNEQKKLEEEEKDYLDPSRWWFASTACPLIAGTFGPMANAFSLCAVVENWRVYIPPFQDEGHAENIDDPQWLIAINSISLFFAVIANLALLLNMAQRLSFRIAQPITIIGWYLSSILLIILICLASSSIFRNQPADSHALTQAFYYAIIAAALYAIIASLMILTVVGAYKGHYPKEFRLTVSQRTLMLQTIGFVAYLLLGALIYSKLEGWQYLDAVYWADFTLLTIGLGGEFVPKTHTGRGLLFPYAIGGTVMVGLVIGSIRSLVLERGKEKMSARFFETKRQRVLTSLDEEPVEEKIFKLGWFEKIKFDEKGMSETERREKEFEVMRRIQQKAERNKKWFSLTLSTIAALLLWCLGALVFMYAERPQGWTYFVSLYFSYTSLLTIGYGDFTLNSNSGKPFFVFWSLLAVPTLTILISNMSDTVIKAFKDFTIWIGSITVLPGENGALKPLKSGARRIASSKLKEDEEEGKGVRRGGKTDITFDRFKQHVEDEGLKEAQVAGEGGDKLERDIRFYHYILIKETRQLMKDVDASPPKQYSYQEWAYYLKLIGQDETDPRGHRRPHQNQDNASFDNDGPNLGVAHGKDNDGHDESGYRWSWLGIRSPLMGNKSEAQWLLERVAATLEKELLKEMSGTKGKRNRPPISMDDLNKGRSRDDTPEAKGERKMLEKDISGSKKSSEVRRRGMGDEKR
ncbi:potassium channel-like protein [Delitschia confertaspora ATCC 74209]|uniref:Potassium channel-like protein n=1 Tax=Delitschia confertaspora ATCC 74209 TaxID=1513339 RepID=A0A9P4MP15_9PLEO|nr:potassium channel-like protein [Delitschia confertaspora ATCC 74209]